jgi:hypothetical protein
LGEGLNLETGPMLGTKALAEEEQKINRTAKATRRSRTPETRAESAALPWTEVWAWAELCALTEL